MGKLLSIHSPSSVILLVHSLDDILLNSRIQISWGSVSGSYSRSSISPFPSMYLIISILEIFLSTFPLYPKLYPSHKAVHILLFRSLNISLGSKSKDVRSTFILIATDDTIFVASSSVSSLSSTASLNIFQLGHNNLMDLIRISILF